MMRSGARIVLGPGDSGLSRSLGSAAARQEGQGQRRAERPSCIVCDCAIWDQPIDGMTQPNHHVSISATVIFEPGRSLVFSTSSVSLVSVFHNDRTSRYYLAIESKVLKTTQKLMADGMHILPGGPASSS